MGTVGLVWHGMVCCRYGMILYGRFGMVLYVVGMVFGMAWYGNGMFGMAWYGMW